MATLAEIVARVERRVIDLPTAVSAESQTLVEEAHRELQELHNFAVMERRESRRTTLGNPSLGLINAAAASSGGVTIVGGSPGEFFKDYNHNERPFYTDDFGVTRYLRISMNEGEVRAAFIQDNDLGLGAPQVLLHRHGASLTSEPGAVEWKVYPVPDGLCQTEDGEYPILIPFYRYFAAPATSDWFTANAAEYLVAKATAEAFLLNWDEARYAAWLTKAGTMQRGGPTGLLARAINRDKQFRISHVDTLAIYPDVNAPRLGF